MRKKKPGQKEAKTLAPLRNVTCLDFSHNTSRTHQ
jgi:hypothetical protein